MLPSQTGSSSQTQGPSPVADVQSHEQQQAGLGKKEGSTPAASRVEELASVTATRAVDSRTVSIVIAARNNGAYLAQAIQSALQQQHPCEVIYSDDGSTDDSLKIAAAYRPQGLVVLARSPHQGVCAARNRGAAAARGDYLVFLDGDDWLPPDFVERHLAAMTAGIPFVYGPAQAFGEGTHSGTLWNVPEWASYDRWRCNTVNTSALYARWAFEGAGRWRDVVHTMWDWDLSLRASRLGQPRTSTATLQYRQHARSWSTGIGEKADGTRTRFLKEIRRQNARLSIGVIYSGRLPELLPQWLDAIAQSLGWLQLTEKPELVILDHAVSRQIEIPWDDHLAPHVSKFSAIRVLPWFNGLTFSNEAERQNAVAAFMASATRDLLQQLRGDIVWLIEDDILVPPLAARELWETLTDGWELPGLVAGCYRNRHVPDQYVGGCWRMGRPQELRELPTDGQPLEVDFTGTGCAMAWKHYCTGSWNSHSRGVPAHDWAWCESLRQRGHRIWMHPAVRCGHAASSDHILEG